MVKVRFSSDVADAQARVVSAKLIGGSIEFYTGEPSEEFGVTEISKRLATLKVLSFEVPVGGLLRIKVADDPDAALKGEATWFACRAADGSVKLIGEGIQAFNIQRRARVYIEVFEIDFG